VIAIRAVTQPVVRCLDCRSEQGLSFPSAPLLATRLCDSQGLRLPMVSRATHPEGRSET
jgi:hypothetical protein